MAQINTVVGDLAGNEDKILEAIAKGRGRAADLVLLPELAVSGYPPEDLLLKKGFLKSCRESLERIARGARGQAALVGFPCLDGDGVHNSAAVIVGDKIAAVYHKVLLPNYGVFDEERYFEPGRSPVALDIRGTRILVTVCEDIWIEGAPPEVFVADTGASVVANISASPFHAGKLSIRQSIVSGFARRAGAYVCYNNLVGGQDELVFDGAGLVSDPDGNIMASAARFKEDFLVVDLEPEPRKTPPPGATPGLVCVDIGSERTITDRQCIALRENPPAMSRPEEVYEALVLGVRDYLRKNGFGKAVIGLSGGIDSSLVAAVAADALGAGNVTGVTMPSMYTSGETLGDAGALAQNLGIRLITAPIKAVYDSYIGELRGPLEYGEPGVEAENLQARIRGNILMTLSNRFGWLVLTTGNKSEMAVGYATLYGDMAGGFAAIKDVPKTLVYEVSEYVNRRAGREIVPTSVIARPPTAELRPDQKDEDSLPPYPLLDPILEAYIERDMTYEEVAGLGFDPETVHEVVRMVDRNEYKRRQAPPGIKITPKAFGRDRRLPVTNRFLPRLQRALGLKVVVIEHLDEEGPGTLGDFLAEEGAEIVTVRMKDGGRLLEEHLAADAIISMGGPMNVYDTDEFPFLKDELLFLRRAIEAGTPVLGICLGAQMISRALGGRVGRSPAEEIGWNRVELTGAGLADRLFAGVSRDVPVLQWHGDTFEVPFGAVRLARGAGCPEQGFRYKNAYSLQFHIEIDRDILLDWTSDRAELSHIVDAHEEWRPRVEPVAEKVYRNFLSLVRERRTDKETYEPR